MIALTKIHKHLFFVAGSNDNILSTFTIVKILPINKIIASIEQ